MLHRTVCLFASLALLVSFADAADKMHELGQVCNRDILGKTEKERNECKALNIEFASLDGSEIEKIHKMLRNPKLKFLRLRDVGLTAEQSATMISAVAKDSSVEEFVFRENPVDEKALVAFASIFESGRIVMLDLRGTELGDKGAEQLALGLQSGTPGILNLNIDGTGIGDKGMVALMEQLIKTKTVRMILLSNNPIDAEGAKAVAKFIEAKTPLDTVYLKAPPQMGEEARAALREAAKRQKDRVNFYDVKRESIQKNWAHDEL